MEHNQNNRAGIAKRTTEIVRHRSRRIVLGMALSAAAVDGGLALAGSPASAQTNSTHAAQPASVAANKKVILAFLKDVLVEHHGDHAASYFTPNAQFHAGTVGTVNGNANIGGLLTAVEPRS